MGKNQATKIEMPQAMYKCVDFLSPHIKNISRDHITLNMAAGKVAEDLDKRSTRNMGCPLESFNAMNPPGLPPFNLEVMVGSLLMMPHNIVSTDGLCNGTRLSVGGHVIEATILTGDKRGQLVFSPQISLTP